ncbi:MAG TPA: sigma-70 family RNA polymerase sigma factor, partial [Steroidobacteraceae bacterium]|nr:sigma-70 family RNA polymerase sigma factor [Steroidobacteraceae bacterium]
SKWTSSTYKPSMTPTPATASSASPRPAISTAGTQDSSGSDDRVEILLSRCAMRDQRALRELYELVSPQLFGVLLRILKRRALAEEALQDVMVKVWQRADQYVSYRGRAMAWLASIARYRAIDLLRSQRTHTSIDDAPPEALTDLSSHDFADTTTSQRMRYALGDCLGRLNQEQQRCISLAYVEGYSQDQIATAIGSPLGTVKSWMRRGLASLKRCLEQ